MSNGTEAAEAVLEDIHILGKSLIESIREPGTTPVVGWPKAHSSLHEFGVNLRDRVASAIEIAHRDGAEKERARISNEFRAIVQEELPEPMRSVMLRMAQLLGQA